jgi:hypothetical protein
VGFPDRLRTTRDLRLLRSHCSWGPTPWRSLALTGLPYPASLTPVLWSCVPQPWSPSVTMLRLSYHSLLSLPLLVGSAVGTRYMYSVRSRYKMMKQKKKDCIRHTILINKKGIILLVNECINNKLNKMIYKGAPLPTAAVVS